MRIEHLGRDIEPIPRMPAGYAFVSDAQHLRERTDARARGARPIDGGADRSGPVEQPLTLCVVQALDRLVEARAHAVVTHARSITTATRTRECLDEQLAAG